MSDDAAGDGTDRKASGRKDGRRSLLVYMRPDMIKALKRAAVDGDTTVFALVEEAVEGWFERRDGRRE